MRIRNILLVHPTRSIRALIKKYVFAELGDVEFAESDNGRNAMVELNMNPFNMVILTSDLSDMTALELKASCAETSHNAFTPFVILSEDDNGADIEELAQQGFEHVVKIRVRPADLIQKINQVCNPRQWRQDNRYYLPNTKVIVNAAEYRMEGSLINISRGGVLLELVTYEPEGLMKENILLSIRIPGPSEYYDIVDLPGRLSRLNVTEWHLNNSPAALRATFIFNELNDQQSEQIEQVLQLAIEDKLVDDDD